MKTIEELRRELEELKNKAAAPILSEEEEEAARVRAELAKVKAKAAAREREAREARENVIFEDLESQHPDVELVRVDSAAGMIVLRPPSYAKTRHFQQVAIKGKLGPDAIEDYVKPCVVYPDIEALEAMIERYPLITATLANVVQEMASAEAKARDRKSA